MKRIVKGFAMAVSMFSIIPVPFSSWDDDATNLLIPCYPLVGGIIGLIWYGLYSMTENLSFPLMLKALLLTLTPLLLSGFLHVDGLMDTADAVFSRRDLKERRLILKDSHAGAFAVIAFTVFILSSFSGMFSMLEEAKPAFCLLLIPILSRGITGYCVLKLKPISESGYLNLYRRNKSKLHTMVPVFISVMVFLVPVILKDGRLFQVLLVEFVAGVLTARYVYRQLEGISGDLSGCILTVSELFAVIAAAVL